MTPAIKRSASNSPPRENKFQTTLESFSSPTSPRKKIKSEPGTSPSEGGTPRKAGASKNPSTANRLTSDHKSRLMEMALDKFSEHADWRAMSEGTGLPIDTIKSQFKKTNWANLRQAAITKAGQ